MPADQPDQTDMSQNRMDPGAPAIAEHRYTRKAAISGGFHSWSCGELNPGPMTVPSVFYVRSLLAKMAIFLPPTMSQTTVGEHIYSMSPLPALWLNW